METDLKFLTKAIYVEKNSDNLMRMQKTIKYKKKHKIVEFVACILSASIIQQNKKITISTFYIKTNQIL